jgi:hypothetical protein
MAEFPFHKLPNSSAELAQVLEGTHPTILKATGATAAAIKDELRNRRREELKLRESYPTSVGGRPLDVRVRELRGGDDPSGDPVTV